MGHTHELNQGATRHVPRGALAAREERAFQEIFKQNDTPLLDRCANVAGIALAQTLELTSIVVEGIGNLIGKGVQKFRN